VRYAADKLAEAFQLLGLLQPPLGPLLLGLGTQPFPLGLDGEALADVADGDDDQRLAIGGQAAEADLRRELGAVGANGGQFHVGAHRAGLGVGEIAGAVRRLDGDRRGWHEGLDLLARQLAALVAEQGLGLRVGDGHGLVHGDGEGCVGRRLEQPAEPLLGALTFGEGAHQAGAHVLGTTRQVDELKRSLRGNGVVVVARRDVLGRAAQGGERPQQPAADYQYVARGDRGDQHAHGHKRADQLGL